MGMGLYNAKRRTMNYIIEHLLSKENNYCWEKVSIEWGISLSIKDNL